MFDPAVWEPIWKETDRQDAKWREEHARRLEEQRKDRHRVWLLGIGHTAERDVMPLMDDDLRGDDGLDANA